VTHIQAVGSTGTSSGSAVTFPAFTAIGAGHCVVGTVIIDNPTNIVNSVTVGAVSATLLTGDFQNYDPAYSMLPFYLFNISGGQTTVTINFSGTPTSTDHYLAFDEYSGQSAIDGHASLAGNTSSAALTPSIITAISGDTIWTGCFPSTTPTTQAATRLGYRTQQTINILPISCSRRRARFLLHGHGPA
jgi:hypothetical protein